MIEVLKQNKRLSRIIHLYFNAFTTYLIILVIVSLLLLAARFTFSESMVIYFQKAKPDFIQVFFPIDGAYTEESSERSSLFENPINGVRIRFRIDPANKAVELVITKIEVTRLFGTETYKPRDLVTHVKPIQMIDKFELAPDGLLVRSTGNDPAFELQLNKPFSAFQY